MFFCGMQMSGDKVTIHNFVVYSIGSFDCVCTVYNLCCIAFNNFLINKMLSQTLIFVGFYTVRLCSISLHSVYIAKYRIKWY